MRHAAGFSLVFFYIRGRLGPNCHGDINSISTKLVAKHISSLQGKIGHAWGALQQKEIRMRCLPRRFHKRVVWGMIIVDPVMLRETVARVALPTSFSRRVFLRDQTGFPKVVFL